MRARLFVLAAAAVSLTACGGGGTAQTAQVTIGPTACTVTPANLGVGDAEFTIKNGTDQRVPFVVKEDEDTNQVGEVDVDPGGTATLKIHLDAGDEYQTHCGAALGPKITP